MSLPGSASIGRGADSRRSPVPRQPHPGAHRISPSPPTAVSRSRKARARLRLCRRVVPKSSACCSRLQRRRCRFCRFCGTSVSPQLCVDEPRRGQKQGLGADDHLPHPTSASHGSVAWATSRTRQAQARASLRLQRGSSGSRLQRRGIQLIDFC
ncbi:hypothetical protein NDU88_003678 [Pleurodeles waltl]|uniref:Uncharacterized protein n=1 Tax=Pleurodeles waltl TaxID=8319 RepID=A0AAV7LHM8_PLEWA|nr:hypothetical protein NDU88_003678 [Pleurodeles waltl]